MSQIPQRHCKWRQHIFDILQIQQCYTGLLGISGRTKPGLSQPDNTLHCILDKRLGLLHFDRYQEHTSCKTFVQSEPGKILRYTRNKRLALWYSEKIQLRMQYTTLGLVDFDNIQPHMYCMMMLEMRCSCQHHIQAEHLHLM